MSRRHSRTPGVLAAGVLAAALAVPGAVAHGQPPTSAPGTPPPVNMDALAGVNPTPAPIPGVRQTRACITSIPGNTAGSMIAQKPWGQERLRIRDAWQFGQGAGQTVAVIDTGVSPHPRLAGRLIDGGDFVGTDGGLSDCDGHGTLVAGIVAAAPDPHTGFAGVAPEAKILSIRQTSANYSSGPGGPNGGAAGTVTTMANAIVHAADTPSVTVINISEAACFTPPPAGQDNSPALHAAVHYAAQRDIVIVGVAGNVDSSSACRVRNGPGQVNTIVSPAWYDEDVLTVTSIDADGTPSEFDMPGPWVDVAAPGTDITSLDPTGPGLTNRVVEGGQDRAQPIQGTSFAAPYVAGVVALVRARFPDLSAAQVRHRIEQTAQHPAGGGGHDDVLGYGVVDPMAALTDVLPEEQGLPGPPPPTRRPELSPVPQAADTPGRVAETPRPVAAETPRPVALIGTAVGLGTLGVTGFAVYALRRARRTRDHRSVSPLRLPTTARERQALGPVRRGD